MFIIIFVNTSSDGYHDKRLSDHFVLYTESDFDAPTWYTMIRNDLVAIGTVK